MPLRVNSGVRPSSMAATAALSMSSGSPPLPWGCPPGTDSRTMAPGPALNLKPRLSSSSLTSSARCDREGGSWTCRGTTWAREGWPAEDSFSKRILSWAAWGSIIRSPSVSSKSR